MNCPKATHDIKENLKNRDWAFQNVGYGPANPEEPNKVFWADRAKEWNTTTDQAKTMRCGNCAAFIQTSEMMECIRKGIDAEKDSYAEDVIDSAGLGYCELFDFKCAASRTCSSWLVGGPITDDESEEEEASLEYSDPFKNSIKSSIEEL
ncbi:hypothetical protein UFOVP507_31 [uncultured Caudovirales phage]|uniref:Uncharacterized protein n=1 Tax=uncultured Caudovirales phage TaxID=2100421 RepID=A0A6J5MR71_9CAUD|nr:hypothetical protein UFOVP507_31 [uncultured Caudovirales phage]